jgi:hypothetical protein
MPVTTTYAPTNPLHTTPYLHTRTNAAGRTVAQWRSNSATPKGTGQASKPVRLPAGTLQGHTVTVYGRTGTVATLRGVRKGHTVALVQCPYVPAHASPTGLALPACTLVALPPHPTSAVAFAPVQPVAWGHYYGWQGAYGQGGC